MFSLPDRIQCLVTSTAVGLCGSGFKSSVPSRKSDKMVRFLFCVPNTPGVGEIAVHACITLGGAALATSALTASPVLAACIPIIVPITNSLLDAGVPIGEDAKRSMSHMMSVNSAQLSFGLVEFLMGDIVNGFVHMLMAGVGFYVTRVDGIVMLPTFSMASTVFASISLVNLLDMLLTKGAASGDLALTANFIKLATFAHPFLYVLSAYYAWKLIEQLRAGLLSPGNSQAADGAVGSVILFEPSHETRIPFAGRGFVLNPAQNEAPTTSE